METTVFQGSKCLIFGNSKSSACLQEKTAQSLSATGPSQDAPFLGLLVCWDLGEQRWSEIIAGEDLSESGKVGRKLGRSRAKEWA
jgi:hypothetical protein